MAVTATDPFANGALASLQSPGKATTNPKSQLKVDDFIKMMVTQLQQQDPTEPAKNGELLQQMSQIGSLQSSQALQESLAGLVLQNNIGSASNLIGKDVEGSNATTGDKITGTVKTVRVVKGSVLLGLEDGTELPMSSLSSIAQPVVAASGNADLTDAINRSANATAAP
jgi:flagellar basal-body rod modification protein FlgD